MGLIKKLLCSSFALMLLFTVSSVNWAYGFNEKYSVGWQYSRPAEGLSVKIPILDGLLLQPIISFEDTGSKSEHSIGVRLIQPFEANDDFMPYAGAAIGHHRRRTNSSSVSGFGYEAFFGLEYQKYLIRPSIEIGMGSYTKKNGDDYAGFSINVGLMYAF